MAKERSRLKDYAVYMVVRSLVAVVQALTFEQARSFARGLAWLAYRIDKRHRLVADENLRFAIRDLGPGERDRVVRDVYRHFCMLLVEIILVPRKLRLHNWTEYLSLPSAKPIIEALLSDKPIMIVTAHYGNWELAGYALGLFGFRTYAIARPLDNPYLDDFLRMFRERTGQRILAKKGDFDQMVRILAERGVIATLGDQDAGQRGLFVSFFGRPASTHKAIALLALEQRVTLLVTGTPRVGEPMRYSVELEDVIDPAEYDGRPDAVSAITQRFSSALERLVRRHPEQYFWLHRRWKHEPPKSRRKVA